jgi:hypothetical protein
MTPEWLFGDSQTRDNVGMQGTAQTSSGETHDQYRARLESYVVGKDPITIQRETAQELARLIANPSDEVLSRPPAPGKWSVRAILAHMAEDEFATSWRYRQMIEHSGSTLLSFDQDRWAQLGDYESWKVRDSLDLFRLLRAANLQMLARLTPEQWQCYGIHTERGKITVTDLARQMAGHDINHINQIQRLLQIGSD